MEESVISAFHALGIDTKSYDRGTHYVPCPKCRDDRKKKNAKSLLIKFDTGYYECFHCGEFKGFAISNRVNGKTTHEPAPKVPQKFLPDPSWNWKLVDSTVNPAPVKGQPLNGEYEVIWYYRDIHGRITAAKKMAYNFSDGDFKRIKDKHPLHLHTRDAGYYPSLFCEYDLTLFPEATVVLVESEKTAARLRFKFREFLNEFIYISTGGSKGLTDDKVKVFNGRNVIICFDCDNGTVLEDGTIKDPKGREGAEDAHKKLVTIANSRVVDIFPEKNDGTDLADIIHDVDIDYIRGLSKKVPPTIQKLWDEILVEVEPPEEKPLITISGIPIATPGNHSLIIGKKKSRKTLFLVMLISWAIKNGIEPDEILDFDTEQGKRHVYKMRQKIQMMTGCYVPTFYLRGKTPKERQEIIENTAKYWHTPPKIIIVDGIRDLLSNINDPDESTNLIVWLERITLRHNAHIVNVLHVNKTDNQARGHIGSELLNKAEITIELELDEKTGCTLVKCESSRDRPFETFAFTHGKDELPEIVDAPMGGNIVPNDEKKKRLELIFEDKSLIYTELIESIKDQFGVGTIKARNLLAEFRRNGWVVKFGKDRSPDTVYKLITSSEEQQLPVDTNQAVPEEKPVIVDDDLPF